MVDRALGTQGEFRFTLNGAETVSPVEGVKYTVGRGEDNALCLPFPIVSRVHAEVVRLGNDFLLRDNGSTNGTYVNDERVSEQILADGDVVRFGKSGPELVFALTEENIAVPSGKLQRSESTRNLIDSLQSRLDASVEDPGEEANVRAILAETHLRKGNIDAALEVLGPYEQSSTLGKLSGAHQAMVLLWLGKALVYGKRSERGVNMVRESLRLYTNDGDQSGIAEANATLGRGLLSLGDLLGARDALHRALLAARKTETPRLQALAHVLIGRIDWKEGDLEGARYNWNRASRLAEGSNDEVLIARVQIQEAFILYAEGRLAEAAEAYQRIVEPMTELGNVRLLLKVYSSLSRTLIRLGSWAATEALFDVRLRLARQHGLPKPEAIAWTDLAELKLFAGDFDSALDVVSIAIERHGQVVYPRTHRIFGRVLSARGDHEKAIAAFERALEAAVTNRALEEQILVGLELSLALSDAGRTAEAFERLEATEAITPLDPALYLLGRALYTRGCIHAARRETHEANRAFTQSLSIFRSIGDPFRLGLSHASVGRLRAQLGRAESARAHLEEARGIFARLGATVELQRVEKLLDSEIYRNVIPALTETLDHGDTKTVRLTTAKLAMVNRDATLEPTRPQTVIVAVANDGLALILKRGLEVDNYLVDRVQDGRAAIERIFGNGQKYDLIILDTLLEYRSGFDICREVRQRRIESPIVMLGGRYGIEDKIEALQAGADDFISKTDFVFEELLAKMEALLR